MPHALAELVRTSLPLHGAAGREVLSLVDAEVAADDGALTVPLRLVVYDEDASVRAMCEQTVTLAPAEHAGHPGLAAFVRASLASVPALLAEDPDMLPMPSELFFPELLALPGVADEAGFSALIADPVRRAALLVDREERERREAYVAAVGPAYAERLLALRRPRYVLETSRVEGEDDAPPAGASRLGGLPGLPPGFAWPHAGGEPLAFLAQIDLAELPLLPPGPDADLLPRSGVLSVFLGLTGGEDPACGPGRLFFFPDPDVLVRTPGPEGRSDLELAESAITPELDAPALPGWEQPFLALALETFDGDGSPHERAAAPLRDLLLFDGTSWLEGQPRHQLLGWPWVLQSDPLAAAADDERAHVGAPHPPWDSREHAEQAAEWRLLLQVDSEGHDFMLGDGGMVHVVIREPDLRAGRFDRARIVWQMH